MCTAISVTAADSYFGRNLDLEYSYDERVTFTPRNFPFCFRKEGEQDRHYALLGMAYVCEGYPLYYDAFNEKGLAMAGLNFPGNAVWFAPQNQKHNIAPFELIPWVLGQCQNLTEAKALLQKTNITNFSFSPQLPNTPLHWLLADRRGALTAEQTAEGMRLYDDPVGVLANNPPFGWHLTNLSRYMALTTTDPQNSFLPQVGLAPYSRGMGAMGLPGDFSSASRFVRAAFVLHNSLWGNSEQERVSQFFHILGSAAMPKGCVEADGKAEYTRYSCCCNTAKGIYYYTTYENSAITAVDMEREDKEGKQLTSYPLLTRPAPHWQNGGQPL